MQWRATPAILAAVFAQTHLCVAAGAIAVGQPGDVAKRGVSMGFSTNRDTMDEAKSRSMTLCQNSGTLASSILCKVVATLRISASQWQSIRKNEHRVLAGPLPTLSKRPKAMRCPSVGRQRVQHVGMPARLPIATVTGR